MRDERPNAQGPTRVPFATQTRGGYPKRFVQGNERRNPPMISSEPVVQSNDLWRGVHWFAIHAKARRENFGATNLSALGIEILFPRIKFERLLRGTSQEGTKPLFPGYFFARFCPRDHFESVKAVRGVLQVVSSGRIPIPVQERNGSGAVVRSLPEFNENQPTVRSLFISDCDTESL
jgi:Transcription termination factor nusG